jgi:hypothetical protein
MSGHFTSIDEQWIIQLLDGYRFMPIETGNRCFLKAGSYPKFESIHANLGRYMKENSRIRFNPGTKEIEIEGSERFVKAYFNKLREMISGTSEIKTKEWKPVKAFPVKADKKKHEALIEINTLSNKQEV